MFRRPALALFAIAFLGVCAPAQVAPEGPEPNNRLPWATHVPAGSNALGGILVGGDIDWWTITVGVPTFVVASTRTGPGANPLLDTVLDLRTAGGIQLGTNDDFGGSGFSRIEHFLLPGTYVYAVRAFASSQAGTYFLNFDRYVPTALPCGTPVSGSFTSPEQFDVYGLSLTAITDILLDAAGSGGLNTCLEVHHPGGRLLESSMGPSSATDAFGNLRGFAPGEYAVVVRGNLSTIGSYSLFSTCTAGNVTSIPIGGPAIQGSIAGSWEVVRYEMAVGGTEDVSVAVDTPAVNATLLDVSIRAEGVPLGSPFQAIACNVAGNEATRMGLPAGTYEVFVRPSFAPLTCPGAPSVFNLSATSTPVIPTSLSPGDAVTGSITTVGEQDLYRLESGTPHAVTQRVNTPGSTLDPQVWIFAPGGKLVGSDDDGGSGNSARLETRLAKGAHLVVVRPQSSPTTGSYVLTPQAENEIVDAAATSMSITLRWRGLTGETVVALFALGTSAGIPLAPPFTTEIECLLLDPLSLRTLFVATIPPSGLLEIPNIGTSTLLSGVTLATQAFFVPAAGPLAGVHVTNVDQITFP